MEFIQFHPTGMVWPPSVKGILVTESVRGDGGVLRNSEGKRFMFDHVPEVFRTQYAESEEEADRWYDDPENNKRPPELLPRDEVARAINTEVKEGRGSPHGGVFLDVSTRLPAETIIKKLPSMHHQFKELADVDITAEPMEVGPTCHYVMGGVEVDADTAAATVPGLFAAGEVAGGMHGSNRLGGNSLSDLLVFGRRAGTGAAELPADAGRAAAGARGPHQEGDPARRRLLRPAGRRRQGREPVHGAHRPAADDERPGRHHPPRGRDPAGARPAGRARGARVPGLGRGAPPVQPRLAPRARPAEHGARLALRGDGGARAHGEPRRPHPRGPPGDGPRLARRQPGLPGRRQGPGRPDPPGRARDPRGPARPVRGLRAGQVPQPRGAVVPGPRARQRPRRPRQTEGEDR